MPRLDRAPTSPPVAAIAARAWVAIGSPGHHFGSREELLRGRRRPIVRTEIAAHGGAPTVPPCATSGFVCIRHSGVAGVPYRRGRETTSTISAT